MSDERLEIEAEPRTVTGKKVKKLRREGMIPAVLYGQREPQHIQIEKGHLRRVLRVASTNQLINVKIGSKKPITVLTREIQQHLTRGDLIHVDFLEVDMLGTVTSEVTLVGVGIAAPQEDGEGVATMPLQSVQIEASPNDLVSEIEVDLTLIEKHDSVIFVSDLVAPKGVTILTDPEMVVARFETAKAEEEEVLEGEIEEGALPIVGEGEEEEEPADE